jgi:hypothetical protein
MSEGPGDIEVEGVVPLILDMTLKIGEQDHLDRRDQIFIVEVLKNMRVIIHQMQAPLHEHKDVAEISVANVMTLMAGNFIETPEKETNLLVIRIATILRENIEVPGESQS